MKAVLLAAGVGARLRPYTDSMPKCMIDVGGVPVIERTVRSLVEQGVHEFAINLYYCPGIVRSHLGSGNRFGCSIRYFEEDVLLGTAGALSQMKSWLTDDNFFVVFADNILQIKLSSLLERHLALHATATLALYWREDVQASGVAELTSGGRVTKFIEKPKAGATDSHWINAGVLCCHPRVLRFIPDGFSDFGHDLLPSLLDADEVVAGYQMTDDERLYWIDTPEDLRNTENAIAAHGVRQ